MAAELEPDNERPNAASRLGRQVPRAARNRAEQPGLATGRAHGLIFTPAGHQLAVLSEEEDELDFWDVQKRRQLTRAAASRRAATCPAVRRRGRRSVRSRPPGPRRTQQRVGSKQPIPARGRAAAWRQAAGPVGFLASVWPSSAPYIADVLPGEQGLGLLDLLSGSPLRSLNLPDHFVDRLGRRAHRPPPGHDRAVSRTRRMFQV